MIFFGDISLPYKEALTLSGVPDSMLNTEWFANLEGTLLDCPDRSRYSKNRVVYNDLGAIRHLVSKFPFKCFSIANNHILDIADVSITRNNLSDIGVIGIGAGRNISEASQEYICSRDKIVIVAFGWERIKCILSDNSRQGVNPLYKENVLFQVKRLLKTYPDYRVIPFMHWNTELEKYPMPLNRELAHSLIDVGCYAVIGCHSHRPEPIEIYKGCPIVYGLGNFLFKQGFYMNSTLTFPMFSHDAIAVEILDNKWLLHFFHYEADSNNVKYVSSEELFSSECEGFNLNDDEYYLWFKKNRFQRKGTITYRLNEPYLAKVSKIIWDSCRTRIIDLLVKYPKLFNLAKSFFKK